ncbi:hypothetical protein BU26DRAFT_70218 [Trematosphaeria pertusa]|uniref:Uncharacterized protein n=1 Tax=Trematosphaeria pertusa TaxID=390896 RepID=A0A6A6I7J5_9PLEO|nr:uncharacterized protein BU26DRAFT_70218 [Trematosphaeria pertusa]KAF2245513.1 hypothetical protein BU26DRAFT_70218 [Trematosphaeria pertusa]
MLIEFRGRSELTRPPSATLLYLVLQPSASLLQLQYRTLILSYAFPFAIRSEPSSVSPLLRIRTPLPLSSWHSSSFDSALHFYLLYCATPLSHPTTDHSGLPDAVVRSRNSGVSHALCSDRAARDLGLGIGTMAFGVSFSRITPQKSFFY